MPTTLEEEVTPAPGGTESWVQETKFVNTTKSDPQKNHGENRTTRPSVQNEATGQPPDYNQTMNLQPTIPQLTSQFQYGYQINGTGLNQ